jgi:putative transposase
VVEPGPTLLEVLCFVERSAVSAGVASAPGEWPWCSSSHHLGGESDGMLTDTAEYWALGNTPFDRAAAYRDLLNEPLTQEREKSIADAAIKGWALGTAAFVSRLQGVLSRPVAPRRRGRPAKAPISVPN